MVERGGFRRVLPHLILLGGLLLVGGPIVVAVIASSHAAADLVGRFPASFGSHLLANYGHVLAAGGNGSSAPAATMLFNSLVMALGISIGKIVISIASAYAIVYFRFPLRRTCFWLIFITLMLPVQVRILPTYQVVADLHMLDSYSGLIVPLIASATATFLFRQFFFSLPDELLEAARIDGAGPLRFFRDIVLPLSRTTIAALFVVEFIYGWNLYLWPLIVTTQENMTTIVMGIQHMIAVADEAPSWNWIMATAVLAMLPPLAVVILMQRQFVKSFVDTEK
ncbi:sn-glycerol-3-phosphate ABC transporter permease UgpE [Salinisphaera sp. RV14]|uniref:sn-glycerol-3-phosphate ABC transporter permease UgpE n=1 Tax=unclassified Salinisphaera TaxID=2649847 RepID=UPI003F85D846